ncbi:kinase-like protein, partial [Dothidotthia symphoricarpi CBS 119687]
PSDIDKHIKYYVQKTTGTPSRKALLAVFLYQYREELLSLFLKWLRSDVPDIPSDDSMPFTRAALHRYGIPFLYHHGILGEQAIFKPVTIQRLLHQKFSNEDRLPFIGGQEPIKTGSSGDVVKTEIAQHHWEIDVDGEIIPGNPNNTTIVALKTFKKDANRSMDEATRDFNIELNILKELRSCKTKHDMIMLDWGSITIVDHQGAAISHSLIFELATFSLEDLLKDEDRAKKYLRKGLLLASLVDIVEALACLHDKVQTFHFDIKPDNILIFERDLSRSTSGNQSHHELIWKLSDFGLARKKAARQRVSIASGSAATSVSSTLPATRPPGLYQAPEIQQQNISQAGQGSDVWSIGIVALMVLAFMSNGPTEVSMLETWLKVSFNGAGREPLTYVRSDQRSW